jgi:hypothetical protein
MLVYDVKTGKFFDSDPLPYNVNGAQVYIKDDKIYVSGGEASPGCVLGSPVGQHSFVILSAEVRRVGFYH